MKIVFSKNFLLKFSKVSIFITYIFQFWLIITISHISTDGFNEENITLLIFNFFLILALHFYNKKINKVFNLRGKYLFSKREKMTQEEINKENAEICEELFLDIFDGDFRP